MEGFDEFILKNKSDLGKVSHRARVLKIHCPINKDDAIEIMKQCRAIEEIKFERRAFERTEQEVKQYLDKYVFVEME